MRMLVEYKPFEPGFYHTDLADWGMAYSMCEEAGDRRCVVDLGHHRTARTSSIWSHLLAEGMLGGSTSTTAITPTTT